MELKRSELFELLDRRLGDRRALTPETVLEKGTILYLPDEPADKVYLVLSGRIRLFALTGNGREVFMGFVHPGEIFGELALLESGTRDHGADVHKDAEVRAIPRGLLVDLLRSDPEVSFRMIQHLGRSVEAANGRLKGLLFKSAHARLARTLLSLSKHYGVRDARGILVTLRVSQQELGSMVGLSRERVNVCLKDFKKEGWIESSGRKLRLVEPEMLAGLEHRGAPKPHENRESEEALELALPALSLR